MVELKSLGAVIAVSNYSNIQPIIETDSLEDGLKYLSDLAKSVGNNDYADSVAKTPSAGEVKLKTLKAIDGTEVYFNPKEHTYTDPDGKVKYLSGSTFANLVATPFDAQNIAQKVAKDGLTADQVLKLWDMKNQVACDYGEAIHKAMETYQRFHVYGGVLGGEEKILPNSPYLAELVKSFFTEERKKEQALPEVFIANKELGMCGVIDRLVFLDKDSRTVEIQDFKGLALDTPIPTPNGFTTMGDLKEGELVFDGNGNPTKVTHKSSVHHKKCYKITFDTNETVIADWDHRWLVVPTDKNKQSKEEMVETHELQTGMKIKLATINKGVGDVDLPVDPYVLGAWLGDGNRTDPIICNPDKRLWDEIVSRGYELSVDYERNSKHCETHRLIGVRDKFASLGLLNNKHIPDLYITKASYKQRLDLLRGIMDTDGYWNKARQRVVLNTTQKWFARDVVKLLSSLGIKASVHQHTAKGFGLIKTAWYVDFVPNDNPFLIRNQDLSRTAKAVKSDHKYIKSVEAVKSVPTQCIAVESETHSYLYGYWFTKTHNTNDLEKKTTFIKEIREAYQDVPKNKLGEYYFQLSFYATILKKMGYNVKTCRIFNLNDAQWDEESFKPLDLTKALEIVRG